MGAEDGVWAWFQNDVLTPDARAQSDAKMATPDLPESRIAC
jgi:hypothetical protein